MPNLKNLRIRIKSVQSTKKITSAMKMISVAKLRKAQKNTLQFRKYQTNLQEMINGIITEPSAITESNLLLRGHKKDKHHLIIVCTSARGLCGNFNTVIIKQTINQIDKLLRSNRLVKILILGKKGKSLFTEKYQQLIINKHFDTQEISLQSVQEITEYVLRKFDHKVYDSCTLIYNYFISALKQKIVSQQIIPYQNKELNSKPSSNNNKVYLHEPNPSVLLDDLLKNYIHASVYGALTESYASEQGARMSAMDGATRNANDLINKLSINYNRIRQSCITSELTEIISGAEAL